MQIEFNGTPTTIAPEQTLAQLASDHIGTGAHFAVAVNATVIPRPRWDTITMHEGDTIEVVHAVGGG